MNEILGILELSAIICSFITILFGVLIPWNNFVEELFYKLMKIFGVISLILLIMYCILIFILV